MLDRISIQAIQRNEWNKIRLSRNTAFRSLRTTVDLIKMFFFFQSGLFIYYPFHTSVCTYVWSVPYVRANHRKFAGTQKRILFRILWSTVQWRVISRWFVVACEKYMDRCKKKKVFKPFQLVHSGSPRYICTWNVDFMNSNILYRFELIRTNTN